MFLLFLIGIGVIGMFIWAIKSSNELEKEEKRKKEREAEHAEWKSRWEAERNAYDLAEAEALAELEAKWGKCVNTIMVDMSKTFTIADRVYVFEESEVIIMDGVTLKFKDIIGFSLLNKSKKIYDAYTTATSKKNLGSAIIRGAVGKAIAGDLGGVIGAMSAEEDIDYETSYEVDEDDDYKMYVNVNSLSSPTIVLKFGCSESDAYETANLLNVIVNRNRQTAN